MSASFPKFLRAPVRFASAPRGLEPAREAKRPSSRPLAVMCGHHLALGGALGTAFVEQWLGAGGHGEVYAIRLETRAGPWALKVVDCGRAGRAELLRAALLQRRCAGPWVVQALPPQFVGNCGYLVQERAQGPSLEQWVEDVGTGNRLALPQALGYFLQMVHAVRHCHTAGVVHLDIKPENFLLVAAPSLNSKNALGRLKLTDFGNAREFGGHAVSGTPTYLAPEALLGLPATRANDLWALGVSLFRLLVGIEPYYAEHEAQILRSLGRGEPAYDLADLNAVLHSDGWPFGIRSELVHLVRALMHPEPGQRLGIESLLAASIFRLAQR